MEFSDQAYHFDDKPPAVMAGFGLRLVAAILDAIILTVFIVIVLLAVSPAILSSGGDISDFMAVSMVLTYFLGIPIVHVLYHTIFESSKHQATPGKMALGIQVTDMYGERVSFLKALGRNLGKFISQFILFIGHLMAIFTEKQQALHDMIASTLVVKKQRV